MSLFVSGKQYICRRNIQGDITHIFDIDGKLSACYTYDAWGNNRVSCYDATGAIIVSPASTHIGMINPFRYRGYYYDTETELYYLQSRYYDPELGRFISQDDVSYLQPDTIGGLNLYAYCGNNPVMRVDPRGNWWQSVWDGYLELFDSIAGAAKTAWKWVANTAAPAVGKFFVNNWDIMLGAVLIVGAVVISVVTFGAATVIAGIVVGAIIGGAFGAISAAASGDNILMGFLSGAVVGALGGVSPWAAALGATGMSLISDRINGRKANGMSLVKAVAHGITAGVFAGAANSVTNSMLKYGETLIVEIIASFMSAFMFSTHNFVSDLFIDKIVGW